MFSIQCYMFLNLLYILCILLKCMLCILHWLLLLFCIDLKLRMLNLILFILILILILIGQNRFLLFLRDFRLIYLLKAWIDQNHSIIHEFKMFCNHLEIFIKDFHQLSHFTRLNFYIERCIFFMFSRYYQISKKKLL